MNFRDAALNHLVPAVVGGAWGLWVYSKQDHRNYAVRQHPGVRGWTIKQCDRLQSGKLGAVAAVAISSLGLWAINNKYRNFENNLWFDTPIRVLANSLFFLYSRPSSKPGFKASAHIFRAYQRVLKNFELIMFKTHVLCLKEIYNQPFKTNFRIAPFDFLLPTIIGGAWGTWLYYKQDPSPTQYFPARDSHFEEWILRQNDKLQNGPLGLIGALVSSSLGLFTLDQLSQPFFPQNAWGKIFRFSTWSIYGLLSLPSKEPGFKAIPRILYANSNTFKFINWSALTITQSEDIKDIFGTIAEKFVANPLNYVVPAAIGAAWGAMVYDSHHLLQMMGEGVDVGEETENTSTFHRWMIQPVQKLQQDKVGFIVASVFSCLSLLALDQLLQHTVIWSALPKEKTDLRITVWSIFANYSISGNKYILKDMLNAFYNTSFLLRYIDSCFYTTYCLDNGSNIILDCYSLSSRVTYWVNNRDNIIDTSGKVIFYGKKSI